MNHTPTKVVLDVSLEEACSKIKPNVSHFRVFGCEAWAHIPNDKHKAMESKIQQSNFVGYSERC
jgi:hypothetical protein